MAEVEDLGKLDPREVVDQATRFVEEAELIESMGSLARLIAGGEHADLIEMEARNVGRAMRAELRHFRAQIADSVYDATVSVLRDNVKHGAVVMAGELLERATEAGVTGPELVKTYTGPCVTCGRDLEGVSALGRYAKRCPGGCPDQEGIA